MMKENNEEEEEKKNYDIIMGNWNVGHTISRLNLAIEK